MASAPSIKVLFVASEVYPLVKTGGLADVSASLPKALLELGIDVRILLPGYPAVLQQLSRKRKVALISNAASPFPDAHLLSALLPNFGVPLLVIDCPSLYDRDGGLYQDRNATDYADNYLRFGLLSHVAALLGNDHSPLTWRPDIIHCNDWQAGLAPAYLHFTPGARPATITTIHNLAFQGIFPPETLSELALPADSFQIEGIEYYGNLSMLKAALFYSDKITTVSPTYAQEIQHEPLGMGLQGLLATRQQDLVGILNGIDEAAWDPIRDSHITQHYDAKHLYNKNVNKTALQQRAGLRIDSAAPLFGIVSRLTHQKGIDLIIDIIPQLMEWGCQLAVLGSGDATNQNALMAYANQYPGQLAVTIGYDEKLSHLMTAGNDIFLMPSRFEPCGLNQMYSQRYGSPPVVHATGGLVDSVTDCTEATLRSQQASGFVFDDMSAQGLLGAVKRSLDCYRDDNIWPTLQRAGMARDFGWNASAARYVALYRSLTVAS
ncbi:MAG: glycogen synthase GlgA [Burkholderiales bacterium]